MKIHVPNQIILTETSLMKVANELLRKLSLKIGIFVTDQFYVTPFNSSISGLD